MSALLAALERRPGNLWFGWDGRVSPDLDLQRFTVEGVKLAGLALSRSEKKDFYLGFCNQALWPLLHCFQDRVGFLPAQIESYVEVQRRFARELVKLLAPGDRVWVHDYHLFLLGRELRRQGFRGRIGFFLHTPFPPHDLWALLPQPEDFLAALLAFDLVGFHTEGYVHNYADACQRLTGTAWDGERLSGGPLAGSGRAQRVGVYPVGIEPQDFEPNQRSLARPEQDSYLAELVGGRKAVLAVDRLDYTKGLPERFARLRAACSQRIPSGGTASAGPGRLPSRGTLPFYRRERREVELLVGRINGMLGDGDWVPIRYFHRSFPKPALARLYRGADVGAGDAAARRHEPGRQGVRGRARPTRTGGAGALPLRRRRRGSGRGDPGQPLRAGRGRRRYRPGPRDAPHRAPSALRAPARPRPRAERHRLGRPLHQGPRRGRNAAAPGDCGGGGGVETTFGPDYLFPRKRRPSKASRAPC